MVYFKITKRLLELIHESKLEGLVGCQKYCDRQFISYNDLDKVIQKLRKEYTDIKSRIEKKKEMEQRKKDVIASGNAELLKQIELLEYTSRDKIPESYEELEKQMSAVQKYETLEIKDAVQDAEIVFQDEHICNDNLKKRGKDEGFFKPEEIIEENEKSKKSLKELEKTHGEDPKDEMKRIEQNKVVHEQMKGRVERRKYNASIKDLSSFLDPEDDTAFNEKQEFRFTLAFGFGFITLMFLSFVCGYFLGVKVFGLSQVASLILSLVVGISTIIMETILFVIRMEKMEAQKRRKVKEI